MGTTLGYLRRGGWLVSAAPASSLAQLLGLVELRKTFFQFPLLGGYLFSKNLGQLLVEKPKFLKIHSFEILLAHSILVTVRLTGCPSIIFYIRVS
ncbi:hypothetical protein ACVWW7_001077 [Bradyrhizobium sp. LM6.9]